MKNQRALLFSTSLGSALEYYDFVIFMMLSGTISATFFPEMSPFVAKLQTLSLFAAGYLARPVGGMLFGHLGDKYGRKSYFTLSILLMALSTLCIAILPGYQQIGDAGAIILCLLRITQGIAQGAELPGALTFVSEHSPDSQRGWRCGLVTMGVGFGASFSSLVSYTLSSYFSHTQMLSFGWRIPFVLGGLIAIVGYIVRKKTQESPAFLQQTSRPSIPIVELVKFHPTQLLQGIGLTLFAACFIIFALYLPTYLHEFFNYSTQSVMLAFSISVLWSSALIPILGAYSDKVGRAKLLFYAAIVTTSLLTGLFKLLALHSSFALYAFMLTYQSIIALFAACYPVLLGEIFPTRIRYSGMAFCYNTSFSIAGLIPLIASSLLEATHWAYSVVVLFSILALITAFSTRRVRLSQ